MHPSVLRVQLCLHAMSICQLFDATALHSASPCVLSGATSAGLTLLGAAALMHLHQMTPLAEPAVPPRRGHPPLVPSPLPRLPAARPITPSQACRSTHLSSPRRRTKAYCLTTRHCPRPSIRTATAAVPASGTPGWVWGMGDYHRRQYPQPLQHWQEQLQVEKQAELWQEHQQLRLCMGSL